MLYFYTKNGLLNVIGVILLASIFWIPAFLSPLVAPIDINAMPLLEFIYESTGSSNWLQEFAALTLLILQAFYLNYLSIKHNFYGKSCYMTALVYTLLMVSSPGLLHMHPFLLGNFLIMLLLDLCISMYKKNEILSEAFYSGVLCGLLMLIKLPLVFFIIFVWASIAIMRSFNWREYVAPLLGFLFPFVVLLSFYYWQDKLGYFFVAKLYADVMEFNFSDWHVYRWITISFIILFIVMGVLRVLTRGLIIKTLHVRKIFTLVYLLLIISPLPLFFENSLTMASAATAFIPLAILLSNLFLSSRSLYWYSLLFYSFIGFILYKNLSSYLGIL